MNTAPPRRTGSLWAVSIGLLLLGLAGCACNSMGIAGSVMQQRMFDEMGEIEGADGPDGMMTKMKRWQPITMALAIGSLLFSTLVMVCAVLVLIWHRSVPKLVPVLMMATIVYIVLQTGVTMYSQYEMVSWTSELGGRTGFGGLAGMTLGFSLCVPGGWAFLKIAFFVYVAMHLRKPEVAQLFGGQAPAIGPRGD